MNTTILLYSADVNVVLDEELGSYVSGPQDVSFPLYAHLTEKLKLGCGPFEEKIRGTSNLPSVMEFELSGHSSDVLDTIEEWLKQNYGEVKRETLKNPDGSETTFYLKDKLLFRKNSVS